MVECADGSDEVLTSYRRPQEICVSSVHVSCIPRLFPISQHKITFNSLYPHPPHTQREDKIINTGWNATTNKMDGESTILTDYLSRSSDRACQS